MTVRDYSGTAKPTVLSGAILAASTIINMVDGTGWPNGSVGPFVVTIDSGTTSEEKVLVATRTGNTLTVASGGRGWDGTTASDHSNAASVAHTYSATDAREANAHVNDTSGDPHPQYLTPAEGAVLYPALGHTHNYSDPAHTHTYESVTLKPDHAPLVHTHDYSATAHTHAYAKVATGSYTGDGTSPRTIELGFQPYVVFLSGATGDVGNAADNFHAIGAIGGNWGVYQLLGSGLSAVDGNARYSPMPIATGFRVDGGAPGHTNTTGILYSYTALGL